jgi:Bacterial pre-peptidase C-terminal domain
LDTVQADYIPGIPLVLPTTDSVLIPLLQPVAGTGSTGSAPTIATPALGEVSAFFDAGTFTAADISGDGASGAQYYKFTLAEAGSVNISLNWTNTTPDLDLILCSDATCSAPDFVAAGSSQPEAGDYNLPAGTYYIVAAFFPSAAPPLPPDLPPQISITITRTS